MCPRWIPCPKHQQRIHLRQLNCFQLRLDKSDTTAGLRNLARRLKYTIGRIRTRTISEKWHSPLCSLQNLCFTPGYGCCPFSSCAGKPPQLGTHWGIAGCGQRTYPHYTTSRVHRRKHMISKARGALPLGKRLTALFDISCRTSVCCCAYFTGAFDIEQQITNCTDYR